MFPALGTKKEKRNGGVPQEGNLTKHLEIYRQHVDELVPEKNNSGLIIIDFESWRPTFRQNYGVLAIYKDVSYQIERERHPFWFKQRLEAEAERRFESSGRKFVEDTLKLSRDLRPFATWGYYSFPYCFSKGLNIDCPREIKKENDRMDWMFFHSNTILPSVYLHEEMKPQERQSMVTARLREAVRASKSYSDKPKPIYVYIRYVYADSRNLLTENDLLMVFQSAKSVGATGIILWGSSYDLRSRKSCEALQQYLEQTMGPISHSFGVKRMLVDLVTDVDS